ncbi:GNAT family N-acetyltransferase [Microbulbifer hainanensis]|uniref:GNAT family N-acetyltransferase n=1 Tax=Microbulbifer hainanensis TaxID=2735675 RepID=UPI0018685DF5|nr:GNAT family N-acetyltransferase [Microbulbifer hainanensis]
MSIKLRKAKREDSSCILKMLHDLGHSDGVAEIRTTESDLLTNIFSDQPVAYAMLILVDEKVAGFLIYSWKWATFTGQREMYMQAIYVSPEYRRNGVARSAMSKLASMASDSGCTRIEWYVVKDKTMNNGFYESIKSHVLEHMEIRRVAGG